MQKNGVSSYSDIHLDFRVVLLKVWEGGSHPLWVCLSGRMQPLSDFNPPYVVPHNLPIFNAEFAVLWGKKKDG